MVPARYRYAFSSKEDRQQLETHRGWDPGALILAKHLSARFTAPLIAETTSRLLIDMNRSDGHRHLFSRASRGLTSDDRAELLSTHRAYHARTRSQVEALTGQGSAVLHVSIHSFTPIWNGTQRTTDIGLLYDPGRSLERNVALRWKEALHARTQERRLCVSRNAPYRGTSDGLTKCLRRHFADADYAGLELEVNQRHLIQGSGSFAAWLRDAITGSLEQLLSE